MRYLLIYLVWVYVVAITVFFGYQTYKVVEERQEIVVEEKAHFERTEEATDDEKSEEPIYYEATITYAEPEVKTLEVALQTTTEKTKKSLGVFKLTAYCSCVGCCEEYALNRPVDENGEAVVYTASGNRAVQGVTVAVDPSVIPYGTELEINGNKYVAHDCGGDIKESRIDVYFESHTDAWNFGTQYAEVFVWQ